MEMKLKGYILGLKAVFRSENFNIIFYLETKLFEYAFNTFSSGY